MSSMIHAWRWDVRTVAATDPDARRRHGSRPVDACRSCSDSPEALRISSVPWPGREGNRHARQNFLVELIIARPISDQVISMRHCGHRCAGPFVSRNLEA